LVSNLNFGIKRELVDDQGNILEGTKVIPAVVVAAVY
jgi:hypothetical protein